MDFEGSLDEVRFYNRSFTDNDVAILYGNGNGDLGLTPIITLDVDNSSLTTTGRVEFLKFGVPHSTTGLDPSDFMISGGNLSNLSQNGSGYDFDFSAFSYPANITIALDAGAASAGQSSSNAISQSFVHASALTAQDNLVLWYTFDDLNASMIIEDFSGFNTHGSVTSGKTVAGKFNSALHLSPGEYLSVNGELLSLTSEVTVSLWAKVLDDGFGVLARNGQLSLQYQDDNTIRGSASTSAGWGDANARLPSGRWVHYVVSYDGSSVRLYLDGILVSETSHNGYLAWGDGSDHNLYLNRYSVDDDWKANAFYDDFRIFNRSLSIAEVGLLYSAGAGDLGIRPHVSGTDPFYKVPSSHTRIFY